METNPFRAARGGVPEAGPPSRPKAGDGARAPGERARAAGALDRARAAVAASAPAHPWLPRALLLPVLAWVLSNGATGRFTDGPLRDPFGGLTLVVHEAGHAAFSWLGSPLLTTAGGTVFQLAIPLVVAWTFARRSEWVGAAVGVFWLGTSLVNAGIYAADALDQALPRVSPWGGADDVLSHDWTVMLLRVGRISRAEAIGGAMQAGGVAVMAGALALAAWCLVVMARAGGTGGGSSPSPPPRGTTRTPPSTPPPGPRPPAR